MVDWHSLLRVIDYHHRKWYEYSGAVSHPEWEECGIVRVMSYLDKLAPGEDYGKIIKQFGYRDRESHARPKTK